MIIILQRVRIKMKGEYGGCDNVCKQGIPVYVASLKKESVDSYATQDALLKKGVHPMFDIAPVAGYIKLVLAYNQKEKTAEEVCAHNLFYEVIVS